MLVEPCLSLIVRCVQSEIVVTSSNSHLRVIQQRYQEKYDRSLLDHICSECSGDYEAFIVQCLKCERQEGVTDEGAAVDQAKALAKAAKGFGCDEKVFIEILGKASSEQTDLIEAAYEADKGESLAKLIKGEMGGDLEMAMLLRLQNPLDANCWLLNFAMDGVGTNEDTVARVLGGADKEEVQKIHARYDEKYSKDLAADLASELGGNLEKACLKWLAPPALGYVQDNKMEADEDKLRETVESTYCIIADIDAVNIKEACEGFGTDDDGLTDVLCFRTKPQMKRINEAYKEKYGQMLVEQVRSEVSGDYKTFLSVQKQSPPQLGFPRMFLKDLCS